MTKADFLACLRNELQDVSTEEREEALKYYSEYFDDAGEENEQNVIKELHSPERVAATIRANCAGVPAVPKQSGYTSGNPSGSHASPPNTSRTILIVLLAIVTFPVWIGILGGLFGALIGILAGIFAILVTGVALAFSGAAMFFLTLPLMATNLPSGLLTAGIGLILLAVGLVMTGLMVYAIGKGVPFIGRGIGSIFHKLFKRK